MSTATLSRLLGRKTALFAASIMTVLAACSDDDSPTGPAEPDYPELYEAEPPAGASAEAPIASLAANGKIAFRSDRVHFSNWELYAMNADGSAQTRLTNFANADREPAWSPDGTRLAFTREVNVGRPDIFVMTFGDTAATNLTNNGTVWDWEATWKPDGSKLAFTRMNDTNWGVYVMSASNGSGQTRITSQLGHEFTPAWSPDGSKLAVTCRAGGAPQGSKDICVMNADGSGAINLIPLAQEDFDPAWSPDGSRIAFTSNRDGNYEIYVMNADGTAHRRLTVSTTTTRNWDHEPTWSPDGTKIAFTTNRDGNYEIYVMNADGTGQTNLTNSAGNDDQPSWQPSGSAPPPPPPPPPPANQAPDGAITSPASNVTVQAGQSVNFAGSGTDVDGTIASYAWSLPGGSPASSTAQNPGSVTYGTPGTYTATLTVTDDDGASDATPAARTITVVAAPPPQNQAPNGTITAPAGDVTIQAGQSVTFGGSGTDADGTVTGYAWSFPGGSPASGSAQNPDAVTFATAGTYTVTLTVTDNGGASDPTPATRTVTVQGATPPPPPPAGATVVVTSTAFTPRTYTGAQGSTVRWAFQGPGTHDVTDKSGMAMFASGGKAPGASYSFTFQGAGTYAYHCSVHRTTHSGRIRVPVQASPARGTRATAFTVTWASADAPTGYVYDIQIKRPGRSFVNWKVGQTVRSAGFTPDRGTGTYSFRARLRKTSNNRASGYSPAESVSVR